MEKFIYSVFTCNMMVLVIQAGIQLTLINFEQSFLRI